jgi:anti-sigma factor RsiW
MSELKTAPPCERQDDLISFLYGEATERESKEFEQHLRQCVGCRKDMTSFGMVRESIGAWKHGALYALGQPVSTIPRAAPKKSAVVALREFFHFSPLWVKGAVAFATVVFCLFGIIALGRLGSGQKHPVNAAQKPGAIYTQEELNAAVKQAIEERAAKEKVAGTSSEDVALVPKKTPRRQPSRPVSESVQAIGNRRPLSRAEREQLAADLRLTNRADENGVDLLGDRINY